MALVVTDPEAKLRENAQLTEKIAAAQTRMASATAAANARMQALLQRRA